MSGDSILPLSKNVGFWAARDGASFFTKWMLAAVLGTHIIAGAAVLSFRFGGPPLAVAAWVFWAVPILVQVCCIFGWRWRTWVWTAVYLILFSTLGRSMMAFTLRAAVETALLTGVRRRPVLWLLASALAHGVGFLVSWTRPGDAWISGMIVSLPINGMGKFWLLYQTSQTVELAMAVVFGGALAWLMPPIDATEGSTSLLRLVLSKLRRSLDFRRSSA